MTSLAQNQLNFQEYNTSMNGPSSPISMEVLKKNATSENLKAEAVGKVFDVETNTYVEKEKKNIFNMPVVTPTSQENRKRKNSPIDQIVYEVYTTNQIADGFSNQTRVVYMGQEFFNTAVEARDVADILRGKDMQCEVYSVKRRSIKNRKIIKKKSSKRRKIKKEPLKCVGDFNVDFGDWQPLPGSLKAKGKQCTWWVTKNIDFKKEQTAEVIRNVALGLKKVQASVLVEKFEEQIRNFIGALDLSQHFDKEKREEVLKAADTVMLNGILSGMGYHCDTCEKSKVRQITMRLRKINNRMNYPCYQNIKGDEPTAEELLHTMKMNA